MGQNEPKTVEQIDDVHSVEDSKSQDTVQSEPANEPTKTLPSIFNLIEQFSAIEEQNQKQQQQQPQQFQQQQEQEQEEQYEEQQQQPEGNNMNQAEACHLSNLPYSAKENDIADFFSESDLHVVDIKLVIRNGRPSGEALVLFRNMDDVDRAVQKNNSQFLSRRVFIKHFPKTGLNSLDQNNRYPDNRQNNDRGNNFNNNMNRGGGGRNMNDRFNDRLNQRNMNNGNNNGPFPMGMNRPNMQMGMGGPNGPMDMNGPNNTMGMSGPNGPMGMNGPNGPMGMNRPSGPIGDDLGPDDFGPPGCVIAMENISFKATVDDIIEFFPGFEIPHRNVMRRFNDNGMPTGDARVCFKNQNEAQQAFRMKRNTKMLGRPIRINIM